MTCRWLSQGMARSVEFGGRLILRNSNSLHRSGFSLLEILLVTIVLATAATFATSVLTPSGMLVEMQSRANATELTSALRLAKQRAMTGGTECRCRLIRSAEKDSYIVEQHNGTVWQTIAAEKNLQSNGSISVSSLEVRFLPNGDAAQAWSIQFIGNGTVSEIQVFSAGGVIHHVHR